MADLLLEYRKNDEKTPEGEVLPEKETLNNARLRAYLERNNFSPDNFDTRFTAATALEILELGNTPGEKVLAENIREGQNYFQAIELPELIERTNEDSFNSTLKKELIARQEEDKEAFLRKAYLSYHTVRKLCEKTIKIQEKFSKQREEEKISAEKSLKESFSGVWEDVKKNYSKMDSKEKLFAVGGLLVGTVLLLKSQNENVKKAKEWIWTGLKIAGGGVAANYIFKLFSGKTALDTVNDYTSSTVANDHFWTETFKTDAEKAEALRKSTIYLGDKDFLDLAKKYREAKSSDTKKIELPSVLAKDMKPEEIYAALDTFFSTYPVEKLELKYKNAKPAETWRNVVTAELVEERKLEFKGNLWDKTVDVVTQDSRRVWNWIAVNERGFNVLRPAYLYVFGKEPTEIQLKNWAEKEFKNKMAHEVVHEGRLGDFFKKHLSVDTAEHYDTMLKEGKSSRKHPNIKFLDVGGDSVYLMSTVSIDAANATPEGVAEKVRKAVEQGDAYLKERFPEAAERLHIFREQPVGTRVIEDSTYRIFMRMPLKESAEYSRKSVLLDSPPTRKEGPGVEIFGPNSEIEYANFKPYDQERFRLRFMVDGFQDAEIAKICEWFSTEYNTKGLSRAEVERRLFEDDSDRDRAVLEMQVKQKLRINRSRLKIYEEKLSKIEKDAASKFENSDAYNELIEDMKRNAGYRIRLAIIGDVVALNALGPKFASDDGIILGLLLTDYEEACKKMVHQYGLTKETKWYWPFD